MAMEKDALQDAATAVQSVLRDTDTAGYWDMEQAANSATAVQSVLRDTDTAGY